MLKRIISAVVALVIVIPLIYLGGKYFAIACGIVSIFAYKEILDLKVSHNKIPQFVQIMGLILLLLIIYSDFDGYSIYFGITYRGLCLTIVSLLLPILFYKKDEYDSKSAFYLIATVIFLGCIFNSLILVRNLNVYLLIYLLLVSLISDTFAFLVGKYFGKHKIAPRISPKKTWEGAIGGLVFSTVGSTIFYSMMVSKTGFEYKYIILTIILVIVGQVGDFVFSKIKRENNIKDFSNIMPGHGGILDRLDSVIVVLLSFIVLSQLF